MYCCMKIRHNIKSGDVFGLWIIINESEKKDNERSFLCQCKCGRQSKVKVSYLVNGKSKRCSYCNAHSKRYYSTDEIPIQQWRQIVTNARKRKIKIDITAKQAYELFLKQNKQCALSGQSIRFALYAGDVYNANASLDRIDPKKPYEIGNIQWVHKDINRMKNIFEQSYFVKICKLIVEHNKNTQS